MQPVFNYGIPGYITPRTIYRTLQEAYATGHLHHVVVFLDVPAFLEPAQPDGRDDDDQRLLVDDDGKPNTARRQRQAQDLFLSWFTMRALVDSAATVAAQVSPGAKLDVRADGTATEGDFLNAAAADGLNT